MPPADGELKAKNANKERSRLTPAARRVVRGLLEAV
jgi:hypothetical protein